MKLKSLLEHHKKFQDFGLKDNLGDGYLVKNNPLFAGVRALTLDSGFEFTMDRNPAYEAFPMLQLDRLIEQKKIPYSNNVDVFPEEALSVLSWEDLTGNLKKNFVFHEAVHACFRSLTPAFPQTERGVALRVLLEESLANACELLGSGFTEDSLHKHFYEMNSYMTDFDHRSFLKRGIEEFGGPSLLKFLAICYLQVNFLKTQNSDKDFSRTIDLSIAQNLDAKHIRSLRGLSKATFKLSERFIIQTNGFHLRLKGVSTPLKELLNFDFLTALEKDSRIFLALDKFAQRVFSKE